MNNAIIDTLTNSLSSIAWKLAGVIILIGIAGIIYLLVEKKIIKFISNKKYESEQKKLEELNASKETKITRNAATYEEWKAEKLAAENKEHPEQ